MTKAYFTPRFGFEDVKPGPCTIENYNGFDFWVKMDDVDLTVCAQTDELTIDGVSVEKLMNDGEIIFTEPVDIPLGDNIIQIKY